jgi:anti-anti-sigma factor
MPQFWVDVEQYDDRVRVTPHGEIDMATVGEVAASVCQRASDGPGVLMDLRWVSYMGADGLRMLLQLTEQATREGWLFTLFNPSAEARRVIDLTATANQLPIRSTDSATGRT